MLKATARAIASAILLVLTGAMIACAVYAPEFVFSFYPQLSRRILGVLAGITGIFPFSVFELLVVLAVLWALYTFIRVLIRRHGLVRWLAGVLLSVSVCLFAFVAVWGLNHFGPDLSEQLDLEVREYSREELLEASQYYLAQANALSQELPHAEDGTTLFSDFSTLARQAGTGYEALGEHYEVFTGSTAKVKRLLSSRLFSYMGITGIFVCLTGESNVNAETYRASLPVTMCHELGHRMGCAAEDEASFCAYLACEASGLAEFRYSGYYTAFIRCYNALYKVDPDAASELWNAASPYIQADIRAMNAHYAQFEGKVQDAAQSVNDTYLKAFSQELGVQSYGAVTDYLIAWYQANHRAA